MLVLPVLFLPSSLQRPIIHPSIHPFVLSQGQDRNWLSATRSKKFESGLTRCGVTLRLNVSPSGSEQNSNPHQTTEGSSPAVTHPQHFRPLYYLHICTYHNNYSLHQFHQSDSSRLYIRPALFFSLKTPRQSFTHSLKSSTNYFLVVTKETEDIVPNSTLEAAS